MEREGDRDVWWFDFFGTSARLSFYRRDKADDIENVAPVVP